MLPQRDGRRGLLLRASRQLIGSSRRGVFGGVSVRGQGVVDYPGRWGRKRKADEAH